MPSHSRLAHKKNRKRERVKEPSNGEGKAVARPDAWTRASVHRRSLSRGHGDKQDYALDPSIQKWSTRATHVFPNTSHGTCGRESGEIEKTEALCVKTRLVHPNTHRAGRRNIGIQMGWDVISNGMGTHRYDLRLTIFIGQPVAAIDATNYPSRSPPAAPPSRGRVANGRITQARNTR